MRPRGRVKLQGQVEVFTAGGKPGSQAGSFLSPPRLGEMEWGGAKVPSRTLLVPAPFVLLEGGFACGSGVCAGLRGGLGEVLFHPTWFLLVSNGL